MTFYLTDEQWKYVEVTNSKKYRFRCKSNAPPKMKEIIEKQIEAHKKWLGIEE